MNNQMNTSIATKGLSFIWESHIMAPDLQIAAYESTYQIRRFYLRAEPVEQKILPEIILDAYGYNKKTPGPVIIMRQGEWLFLTLENGLSVPTGLFIQGYAKPGALKILPDFEQYGPTLNPGDTYTYKLLCNNPGSYLYRSSQDFQVSMGLIGAFIVLPAEDDITEEDIPNRDYVFLMQQWDISELALGELTPGKYIPDKYHRNPNFFTINGRCYPYASPVYFSQGNKVRMRFLSKAGEAGWIHLEGHPFRVVCVNGFSRESKYSDIINDTLEFNSGIRTDIELTANNPGKWLLNATAVFHQSNNGVFPGGIMSNILYF